MPKTKVKPRDPATGLFLPSGKHPKRKHAPFAPTERELEIQDAERWLEENQPTYTRLTESLCQGLHPSLQSLVKFNRYHGQKWWEGEPKHLIPEKK